MQNLEYYKVFYHVAKCGSLTLAAKELSITQPAVSQSIRQLEGLLHAGLFRRTAKGVCLTAEGELLYTYISRGYEQMELGEKKLKQMMELELGEVHIGASDMTLKYYLLPFLEKFHEECPGIRVIVSNAPTPETLQFLEEGKIDFGVVSTPFPENRFAAESVREIQDVFVAGRQFTAYKNRMMDFKDLEKLPVIGLEGHTSTGRYLNGFLAENEVCVKPEFELATSDMIVQFALRNLGIGAVVRDFAQEYLDSGRLFELRFNRPIPKRHFCIVSPKDAMLSEAAKKLLLLIRNSREEINTGYDKNDYI